MTRHLGIGIDQVPVWWQRRPDGCDNHRRIMLISSVKHARIRLGISVSADDCWLVLHRLPRLRRAIMHARVIRRSSSLG
ncbi:hypothetical protein [Candidatus Vallotia lariciata]|uniref:hypothetical protein n=1 Tax=Candidatus Vallotia laricis TaxID=2018052 RepID=UPI001D030520|nr:hypothetical protein [Candidatus Vallotia lariciata]